MFKNKKESIDVHANDGYRIDGPYGFILMPMPYGLVFKTFSLTFLGSTLVVMSILGVILSLQMV